jgi:hypothetical protein
VDRSASLVVVENLETSATGGNQTLTPQSIFITMPNINCEFGIADKSVAN